MKKIILLLILFSLGLENLIFSQENSSLFFSGKQYLQQSTDYTKWHVILFGEKGNFLYAVFDGQPGGGGVISSHQGTYQYSNGQIEVVLTTGEILEFSITQLSQYKIAIQPNNQSSPTIYAEWLSAEDAYTINAAIFWSNNSTVPSYTPPYSTQQNNNKQASICSHCNGSGRMCVLKTVPTYGTQSNVKHRCQHCSELLVSGCIHVQEKCTHCQGTGYK